MTSKREALRQRFAARLREIRSGRGVWQADLAEAAGVTVSTISRFEHGVAEPTFSQAVLIMDKLEVWTIDLMMPGPELPPRRNRSRRNYLSMVAASGSQADYLWSEPLVVLAEIWADFRAQLLAEKGVDIGEQPALDWIAEIRERLGLPLAPQDDPAERRARIVRRLELFL